MANDRLSLGCTVCGQRVTILKYYPTSPHAIDQPLIGPFLIDHLENCHPRRFQMDLGTDSGFIIVTEAGETLLDDLVKMQTQDNTA